MNKLVSTLLVFLMIFLFSGCDLFGVGSSDNSSSENQIVSDEEDEEADVSEDEDIDTESIIEKESNIDNDIAYPEEAEGSTLKFKAAPVEDFYGKWEATSAQAEFMYGSIELNIRESGIWSADFADEDFGGKWKYSEGSLLLEGDVLNIKLSFTNGGVLIMQEDRDGSGEYINTVLTKKEGAF